MLNEDRSNLCTKRIRRACTAQCTGKRPKKKDLVETVEKSSGRSLRPGALNWPPHKMKTSYEKNLKKMDYRRWIDTTEIQLKNLSGRPGQFKRASSGEVDQKKGEKLKIKQRDVTPHIKGTAN